MTLRELKEQVDALLGRGIHPTTPVEVKLNYRFENDISYGTPTSVSFDPQGGAHVSIEANG